MKVKSYKNLFVWQKGIDLVDAVYESTLLFPKKEVYGLSSQMQRAAISIPSNIAEGFARRHTKEYVRFLYIALGSAAELNTQLIIAHRRAYLTSIIFEPIDAMIDFESRLLMNLIKSLEKRLRPL